MKEQIGPNAWRLIIEYDNSPWPEHCGTPMMRQWATIREPSIWLTCRTCGSVVDCDYDDYSEGRYPRWMDPHVPQP